MRLPETDRRRERRLGGTLLSVAAHGAVILLVVYASARGEPVPAPHDAEPAHIIYTAPARPTPPSTARRADGRTDASGPNTPAAPVTLPIAPPTLPPLQIPTGDVTAPPVTVGAPVTAEEFARGRGVLGTESGGATGGDGRPLGVYEVERAAAPRTRIEPRYPEPLRARGIAGAVVARFVVDTTGRVAPGSFAVVEATDSLFADAVREALRRARFTPAEVRGHRVPQLVEQRFEFRMRGGG